MPRSAWLLTALLLVLSAGPVRAQCPGDLNGDGMVTIEEIITMVNAALYGCPVFGTVPSCPEDLNGDGMVTVDEILRAVNAALSGCPTPTATPVPSTPTATATETTTPVPSTPTATATETTTSVPSTPTATATETTTPVPSTPTATATETTTPVPSTPTATATETTTPVPSTPTATATETTTPTPSATLTASPTAPPSACPYTFLDDTLSQNVSCDFVGPFNPSPDCPNDLEALFAGDGTEVGVGIPIAPNNLITFVATVTSATSATLEKWTLGDDQTGTPVSGTIELRQNGQVLVVAPDSPPFDLATDTNQCAFVQYAGTYAEVLSTQAAPAAPPTRHTSGVQPASFRLH
jgi:hypothetical protein